MAEETEDRDPVDLAQAIEEINELKQLVAILERACRQTMVFMDGSSCLDEYRLKGIIKQAIRESSKVTNPKH